ncbi:MAG TPA: carbamoyltransferase HypF [Acidimicrobiales bacterium]|nr:carbamoyltransferase HypF [Acidimicrobiales bacterium]
MTGLVTSETAVRVRLRVTGLVQGVGFRPHVYRLASGLGLAGHVGNDTEGVFAEAEGPAAAVDEFLTRLVDEAPGPARIDGLVNERVPATGEVGFAIVESRSRAGARTFVSPDIATCDECLSELFDPADRRARYPFINCTNCGPRFTITLRLPYDRPHTTMRGFTMCAACAAEYHDPADRRFHAQPVACAHCGPRLWFEAGGGVTVKDSDAALVAAQAALGRGEIVAVKGLGGYHLACDAQSDAAVERLRVRKQRVEKPFAVMVRDLAAAEALADLGEAERHLLASAQRPIVLVRGRRDTPLSWLVAPGNPRVGLLLPYTPLHHLLFAPVPGESHADARVPSALVMTSGNLTDEPICFDDADARARLGAIADAWLVHDRPIHVPCDDSVLLVDPETGEELPLRRSRGYAPLPVRLPFAAPPILAVGGELKNTFCLASGRDAFVSQHIGDMGSLETWAAFERATQQIAGLYDIDAVQVVADAHPGYQTRRWAEAACEDPGASPAVLEEVQHHHAHVASVMAEHGVPLEQHVIGMAFDGTGYGEDGTVWGGEILVAGYREAARVGSLAPVPLPGGDAAIRRPYRVALAHLWAAGIEWSEDLAPVRALGPNERAMLERQLSRGVGCVPTSSMGRLFDATSSLLGLCHHAGYEAQAAMELQWAAEAALARDPHAAPPYRFGLTARELQPAPVLRAIVADQRAGLATGAMAAGFHAAVARAVGDAATSVRARTGIEVVALSGGVFQNTLLLGLARGELAARGFTVLTHRQLPPNDGGLALGQAAVAAARANPDSGATVTGSATATAGKGE